MYKLLIRPILFCFDPEQMHHFTFSLIRFLNKIPGFGKLFQWIYEVKNPKLESEVFGLKFKNPVGLAAGFDKNAKYIDELEALGFGFIEIGTVTPLPQEGNEKPRLFRLKKDEAIINRLGFNNDGADAIVERLKARKSKLIIGGNIGKNKITPNENAVDDYVICFNKLFDYVDYFVVNVSSPNTPNLRELQEKDKLEALLVTLQKLNESKGKTKPILLKIAPDLTNEQLEDIAEIVKNSGIAGLISSNTTISRENLMTDAKEVEAIGAGGVSGAPLLQASNFILNTISDKIQKQTPVIGVGGIIKPVDALTKFENGADMVQIYTGFVYSGPGLVKGILKLLQEKH
jgi:dihydroorotate dehydrogenase